jgi:hypothetical protein
MFEVPGTGQPTGTVVQVLEAGYTISDRLLRPALVGIAKADAAPAGGNGPARHERLGRAGGLDLRLLAPQRSAAQFVRAAPPALHAAGAPRQRSEQNGETDAHAGQEGAGDGQAWKIQHEQAEEDERAADRDIHEHEQSDRAKHELAAGWRGTSGIAHVVGLRGRR